jgi:tetratricopeptide (TPR) repeat protein
LKKLLFVFLLFHSLMMSAQDTHAVDSLYQTLEQPLHDTLRIRSLNGLARIVRNKEGVKALELAKEAYSLSVNNNYAYGVATACDIMGVIYLTLGDFKKALYNHFIALNIFEKQNNQRGIAFSYNNIGSVYVHLKNYSKAELYYQKSLAIKLKNGYNKEASSSYINLGNIRMYTKDLKSCIRYYSMALVNATKYNDRYNITNALMNLGEANIDSRNPRKALTYYTKALPMIKESGNKYQEGQAEYAIGKIHSDLKEYALAETYLKKALRISQEIHMRTLELNIYKYFSKLYERQGKLKEALEFNKLFIALNDSIYSQENTKTISEMQTRYELEKKEEQIKALNQDKEIIQAKEAREIIVRNFFILAFVLISIIAFISFRSVARKQKTNRLLNIKNNQIEWQRTEIEKKNVALSEFNKELMKENVVARYETLKSKINPHFLFNSLSTLSSLIIKDPKTALEFVAKFSKLYRSIMEHGNSSLVTIKDEIEVVESFVYLKKMRYGDSLKLTIDIPKKHVHELIPPFALQLLVENATKHNIVSGEFPLTIDITYNNNIIEVKNNLHPRTSPEPSTGLGQHSITERYKYVTDAIPHFYMDAEYYIAHIPTIHSQSAYKA